MAWSQVNHGAWNFCQRCSARAATTTYDGDKLCGPCATHVKAVDAKRATAASTSK